nr:MAG TPA: hypothetical protein [Caudoviricetes sp.]
MSGSYRGAESPAGAAGEGDPDGRDPRFAGGGHVHGGGGGVAIAAGTEPGRDGIGHAAGPVGVGGP